MKDLITTKIETSDVWVSRALYVLYTNNRTKPHDTGIFKSLVEYYDLFEEFSPMQIGVMRHKIIKHYIDDLIDISNRKVSNDKI